MRSVRIEMVIVTIILLLSFAIAGYFYPQMPERMASHWNAGGDVDGYMSKFWGLFLMPFISPRTISTSPTDTEDRLTESKYRKIQEVLLRVRDSVADFLALSLLADNRLESRSQV